MGSFCGSGTQKTTATTNSSSTTTPTAQPQIQDIFSQIQQASQTPYTPYGGQLTAGLSPTQQAAIGNISAVAGPNSPYLNSAAGYATQGASAIDPSQIDRYLNPYTQSVIGATQANFNESNSRQQEDVLGSAVKQGALRNNRVGVAKAELARQQKLAQDPVIAGLNSSNYTQALAAAQADRGAAQYGSSAFTGLNDAALRSAQTQLGAGAVEQGTQQAGLDAAYQQYLQQQAFPYQQAQFYAQYGLPAAAAMGSSTTGTGTETKSTPGANPFMQLAGLGLSAASMFSDERVKDDAEVIGKTFDGQPIYKFRYKNDPVMRIGLMAQDVESRHPDAVGESRGIKTVDYDRATARAASRGRFASGGSVRKPLDLIDVGGYIPKSNALSITFPKESAAPKASAPSLEDGKDSLAPLKEGLGSLAGAFKGGWSSPGGGSSGGGAAALAMGDPTGLGGLYSRGGGVDDDFMSTVHRIRDGLRKGRGGSVSPFANGGFVPRFADGGVAFDDRFSALFPMANPEPDIVIPDPGLQRVSPEAMQAWRGEVDQANPTAVVAESPLANPTLGVPLPPQIIGPASEDSKQSPLAFNAEQSPLSNAALPITPEQPMASPAATMGGFNPFNLSDKTRHALMSAGLGMAASRSSNPLSAIAEGGLYGMKSYAQAGKEEREEKETKRREARDQSRIDMEAKRLAQSAEQFGKTHGLSVRTQDLREKDSKEAKERGKWTYLGPSEDGKSSVFMNGVTGESEERPIKIAPKGGNKARQMSAGDIRKLTEEGNKFQQINGFAESFKPEYAGAPFLGAARNWVGRTLPDNMVDESVTKGASWWQEYDRYKNQVRNDLFGSALTATEKVAFEKADINPGMSADAVKRNLAIQQKAVRDAMSKQGSALVSEGFNPSTISKAYGLPADHFKAGDTARPLPGDGKVRRPDMVPEGSAYSPSRNLWKAPDGTIYDAEGNKVK